MREREREKEREKELHTSNAACFVYEDKKFNSWYATVSLSCTNKHMNIQNVL